MKRRFTAVLIVIVLILNFIPKIVFLDAEAEQAFKIGDYVQFGTYNGEPILWKVVNIDGAGDPMLVTERVISFKFFDSKETAKKGFDEISAGSDLWHDSNIRQWLNSSESIVKWMNYPPVYSNYYGSIFTRYDKEKGFLSDENFSQQDRNAIKPVTCKTIVSDMNRDRRDGGEESHVYKTKLEEAIQNYDQSYYRNTSDKIFLLSIKELYDYYYLRGWDIKVVPTETAAKPVPKDMNRIISNGYSGYMLRDALYSRGIRYITPGGSIGWNDAAFGYLGVRPGLYLNAAAVEIKSGTASIDNPYVVEGNGKVVESPTAAQENGQALKEGNYFYTVNNGKATIVGYHPDGPKKVIIPEKLGGYPVVSIGEEAFMSRNISSVTLSKSLTSIGKAAFYDNALVAITIGSNVTSIGESAFAKNQLISVILPKSMKTIKDSVFSQNKIKKLTLPNSLVQVGSKAFESNHLTDVTLPAGLQRIGNGAFAGNQLTAIKIPDNVIYIGDMAFYGNNSKSIVFGKAVKSIGKQAFAKNGLTSVVIPDNVTELGESAFYLNQLTSVTIGKGITNISHGVFGNNMLTNVKIGDSVKVIGPYAFEYNRLSSVTIPDSVLEIQNDAFGLNRLTNVTFGKNVKIIGGNAFRYSLITSLTLPDSVTHIQGHAFNGNRITKLKLPQKLVYIGGFAFHNNRIASVTIPSGVKTIGTSAFELNQLTAVNIPNSVTTIGDTAFSNNKLISLKIGSGVKSIGDNAFGNNKLSSVVIPANVVDIPYDLFYGNQAKAANLKVTGASGSSAEKMAKTYGYTFIPMK